MKNLYVVIAFFSCQLFGQEYLGEHYEQEIQLQEESPSSNEVGYAATLFNTISRTAYSVTQEASNKVHESRMLTQDLYSSTFEFHRMLFAKTMLPEKYFEIAIKSALSIELITMLAAVVYGYVFFVSYPLYQAAPQALLRAGSLVATFPTTTEARAKFLLSKFFHFLRNAPSFGPQATSFRLNSDVMAALLARYFQQGRASKRVVSLVESVPAQQEKKSKNGKRVTLASDVDLEPRGKNVTKTRTLLDIPVNFKEE